MNLDDPPRSTLFLVQQRTAPSGKHTMGICISRSATPLPRERRQKEAYFLFDGPRCSRVFPVLSPARFLMVANPPAKQTNRSC